MWRAVEMERSTWSASKFGVKPTGHVHVVDIGSEYKRGIKE